VRVYLHVCVRAFFYFNLIHCCCYGTAIVCYCQQKVMLQVILSYSK